jgi:hydroxyacyl-ACP dehydratase HTD2-like protein with hotdog domain
MLSRKIPYSVDYLSPMPSHTLNLSLSDFLPEQPGSGSEQVATRGGAVPKRGTALTLASYMAYFPPLIPEHELLGDGTDPLHSPGEPFTRRMWAGGSVVIPDGRPPTPLNDQVGYLAEKIVDVKVKGIEGKEKVFVSIERSVYGTKSTDDTPGTDIGNLSRAEFEEKLEGQWVEPQIVERRDIVFMRDKSRAEAAADAARPSRVVKGIVMLYFSSLAIASSALIR